jgi:hypothetical protein
MARFVGGADGPDELREMLDVARHAAPGIIDALGDQARLVTSGDD